MRDIAPALLQLLQVDVRRAQLHTAARRRAALAAAAQHKVHVRVLLLLRLERLAQRLPQRHPGLSDEALVDLQRHLCVHGPTLVALHDQPFLVEPEHIDLQPQLQLLSLGFLHQTRIELDTVNFDVQVGCSCLVR